MYLLARAGEQRESNPGGHRYREAEEQSDLVL
jgi:hypothetical protein